MRNVSKKKICIGSSFGIKFLAKTSSETPIILRCNSVPFLILAINTSKCNDNFNDVKYTLSILRKVYLKKSIIRTCVSRKVLNKIKETDI